MKKIVSVLLILVVVFSLCACGGAKAPKGTYTGRYSDGDVLSVITINSDGTFTEEFEDEHWYGTWEMDQNNRVTCTYGDDGSTDSYVWDPKTDTLDWLGEGRVIYSK